MKYYYFSGCNTIEEVKAKYKSLAKVNHPDTSTGSHEKFTALKNEFDHILEGNALFPITNIGSNHSMQPFEDAINDFLRKESKEEVLFHLSAEEIQIKKATTFFNNLRTDDITFDQIDAIAKEAKEEGDSKLWIYQEVQKLDELKLDHFKYLTFILKDPVSNASLFFRKYQMSKVL